MPSDPVDHRRGRARGAVRSRARLVGIGALAAAALVAAGCSNTPGGSSAPTTTASTSGASVRALQTALTKVGCYTGSIDGIAGPATTRAVRSFQAAVGLSVDGIAGPSTEGQLRAAAKDGTTVCSKSSSTTATVPSTTTTTTAAAASGAPCTAAAVGAALPAGETLVSFRCLSGWAAGAMQNPQYESAFLLRSSNGAWTQAPPDACADAAALGIPGVILDVSPCRVS